MHQGEILKALRRRKDYLRRRIAQEPNRDLTFDKAELSALTAAIAAYRTVIDRKELCQGDDFAYFLEDEKLTGSKAA
jgi:hypothetical protein